MVDGYDEEEYVDVLFVVNINSFQLEVMIVEIRRKLFRQNEQMYVDVLFQNVIQVVGVFVEDERVGVVGFGVEGVGFV